MFRPPRAGSRSACSSRGAAGSRSAASAPATPFEWRDAQRPLVAGLDLERRVVHAEALAQELRQLAPVRLGVAPRADGDVCRYRGEARRDLPDVQVVHLDDVVLRGEYPADL